MPEPELTAALSTLARLEERSIHAAETAVRIEAQLQEFVKAVHELEEASARQEQRIDALDSVIRWGGGLVSAALGTVVAKILNLI